MKHHQSRAYGYPREDGSVAWAVGCSCGFSLVELGTEVEAREHAARHYQPGYERPVQKETLTTSKGEQVVVRMNDEDVYAILRAKHERALDGVERCSNFLQSLVFAIERYGSWTEGQRPWAHKLAYEIIDGPRPAPAPKPGEPVHVFARIVEMLTKAARTLKYPAVEIGFEQGTIRMNLAGSKARVAGSVNVTSAGSFDARTWYGRIHPDGRFEPARNGSPAWVTEALQQFNADPATMARLQGQRYGACCFCRRELTTNESLAVGYGPICAEKFGLPWGEVAAAA